MDIKIRIRGVNQYIRTLANTNDKTKRAALDGVVKAAEYLLQKVRLKFGVYQSTGGSGGGAWDKLKYETIARKLRKGYGNKPLIETGAMRDSFTVIKGGRNTLSASVGSNDPKLIYHVYGARGAGVPQRDPIKITAIEEKDACSDIIEKEIREVLNRL